MYQPRGVNVQVCVEHKMGDGCERGVYLAELTKIRHMQARIATLSQEHRDMLEHGV